MTVHHGGLTADDVWGIIGLCWLFGGGVLATVNRQWRLARKRARKAAEVRHRRKVELYFARRGQFPPARNMYQLYRQQQEQEQEALPAAVIAAPPGITPLRGVPGECRHERIVPVITGDGDVQRWICANYPRCEAEFPASVAVYEDRREEDD